MANSDVMLKTRGHSRAPITHALRSSIGLYIYICVCSCSSLSQVGPPIVEPPGIQSSSRPACARMSASASAFLSRSACWLQGSGGQAA